MFPILQVGPLAIPLAPFSLLLALWLGLSLSEKHAWRRKISPDTLYNLVFTGLIAGVVGARLGYVLQYTSAFITSPLSLVSLNPGLLDPATGVGTGLLGMLIYGQRKKLSLWDSLDALTPMLAVMAVGLAVSHIASGEAFGAETNLPWGINLWGAKRHPSQFYELAAALVILAAAMLWKAPSAPSGSLFLGFVAVSAAARLFLEGFRGDSLTIAGGIRGMQVAAWVIMTAALLLLDIITKRKSTPEAS